MKVGNIGIWLEAARLRTLPLALSSIITGSALARFDGAFRWSILILALLTAVFLQILSNLANDYGDAVKGTDNEGRIGPLRAVQSGSITPAQMRKGIGLTVLAAVFTGMWLIGEGLSGLPLTDYIVFLLLGLASVIAALTYTLGKNLTDTAGSETLPYLFFSA